MKLIGIALLPVIGGAVLYAIVESNLWAGLVALILVGVAGAALAK